MNYLLADDSHKVSNIVFGFSKQVQKLECRPLQIFNLFLSLNVKVLIIYCICLDMFPPLFWWQQVQFENLSVLVPTETFVTVCYKIRLIKMLGMI